MRRAQENCSEALFQLRCAPPSGCPLERVQASACCVDSHDVRRVPASLSAVGKRTMRAHKACLSILRHRARATADVSVGGRCRGALAAIEERRGVGAAAAAAATAAAGAGHLMISCASPPPHTK